MRGLEAPAGRRAEEIALLSNCSSCQPPRPVHVAAPLPLHCRPCCRPLALPPTGLDAACAYLHCATTPPLLRHHSRSAQRSSPPPASTRALASLDTCAAKSDGGNGATVVAAATVAMATVRMVAEAVAAAEAAAAAAAAAAAVAGAAEASTAAAIQAVATAAMATGHCGDGHGGGCATAPRRLPCAALALRARWSCRPPAIAQSTASSRRSVGWYGTGHTKDREKERDGTRDGK